MEGIAVRSDSADPAPIELSLIGPLRASTSTNANFLPTLRKARAIFVVLALSDGQTATRRWLAALLWSRNDSAQGLARLRDTLSTLRQALKDSLGDTDLLRVTADRVMLRPGAVRVDLEAAAFALDPSLVKGEIGADLDGIDPALDTWLLALRGRYRAKFEVNTSSPALPSGAASGIKRGVVIAISALHVIGSGQESELA